MRLNDRNAGSIKALLVLVLLVSNFAVASLRHPERSEAESSDPAQMTLLLPPRDLDCVRALRPRSI